MTSQAESPARIAGPDAKRAGSERAQMLLAAGSFLGAVAASSCCLVLLLAFAVGVGGAWIGNLTRLAPYQPFFLIGTAGFPPDRLPPWIGITFWAGTAKRSDQPLPVVDEFRRGAAFGAKRLSGGVVGIGFEPHETAILDHCDSAAPRDAERAIGVKALRAGMIGHGSCSQ